MNPSLAQTQDVDYDAPHWSRSRPELWSVYGNCGNCFYGHAEGCRGGACVCLLWSTPQIVMMKLAGERCAKWERMKS